MRLGSVFFQFVIAVSTALSLGLGQAHAQTVPERCLAGDGVKCIPPPRITERLVARLDVYTGYPDGVPHIMGPSPLGIFPDSNKLTVDIKTSLIPGVGLESRTLRVKIPGLFAVPGLFDGGQNGSGSGALAYRARLSRISGTVVSSSGSCSRIALLSGKNVKLAESDVQYDEIGEAFIDLTIDARQPYCGYLPRSTGQPVEGVNTSEKSSSVVW